MILTSSDPVIINFDPFTTITQQQHQLGTLIELADRRAFRFSRSGAAALAAGQIATAPIQKPNHQSVAVQAAVLLGATFVNLTLGATASVDQEYAEGLLVIGGGSGAGRQYRIGQQNPTASAGIQTVVTTDQIQAALTTGSTASLVHNGYNQTVVTTTQTIRPSGVPITLVPATASTPSAGLAYIPQHYWGQTRGVAPVLNDSAIPLGSTLTLSSTTAGAVTSMSTTYTTALLTPKIGEMDIKVGISGNYEPVLLSID